MNIAEFKLPDVGEGLTEAEIVSWKVKPGDSVRVNDIIVEIETAKSLVELPCPFAGVVEKLLVDEGKTVDVGTPIISVRTGSSADEPGERQPQETEPTTQENEPTTPGRVSEGRQAVLVGYGPRTGPVTRRRRTSAAVSPPAASPASGNVGEMEPTAVARPSSTRQPLRTLAKPPVRKMAKDLGVDITTITPTGPGGTVTREDVQTAVRSTTEAPSRSLAGDAGWDGLAREERVPIRSVRRATAQAVTRSAFTAPHVTEFVTVDVTRMVKLIERVRNSREFHDIKLSPLAVLAKAMCIAVHRTPDVNSRWDDETGEIVIHRYVNLGIAAATPRGLVVPNIKDADRLALRDLAVAINELASTARSGKTPPEDMLHGTISITNIGVFGIDTGTPILPPGEAAIVAFGAVRRQPWVHKNKVKPRWVTTLGLSFDHRLVDGEQGSLFLADVAALLEDPGTALVWG